MPPSWRLPEPHLLAVVDVFASLGEACVPAVEVIADPISKSCDILEEDEPLLAIHHLPRCVRRRHNLRPSHLAPEVVRQRLCAPGMLMLAVRLGVVGNRKPRTD